MPAKKNHKISENGQLRDATPEESELIEQTRADSLALDAADKPAG